MHRMAETTDTEWSGLPDPDGEVGRRTARVDGRDVLVLSDGRGLAGDDSPRPFAHPITSLAGHEVTEQAPVDHPHHLGLSLAIPDVDGTSHWGGRTFVRDRGYVMLDNHGVQRIVRSERVDGDLVQHLRWLDHDGRTQLEEERTTVVRAVPVAVGASGRALRVTVSSRLRATTSAVRIGSPASNGRAGADYGGWFWRLPAAVGRRVLTADGPGEDAAHGSRSAWIAFVLDDGAAARPAGREPVTVLFRQPSDAAFPWFVRAAEYPGVGVALAGADGLTIEAGDHLVTALEAVIVDGVLDAGHLADLHRGLDAPAGGVRS